MIRLSEIQEKLIHLVGWLPDYGTTDLTISPSLLESETGMYFQQVHPLITLTNLSCIAPDFKNVSYEVYEEGKVYEVGDTVSYDGKAYKALIPSQGATPDVSTTQWVVTDPFSEWLRTKTAASIQKAVLRFCNEKAASGLYKVLCENRTLFDGTARIADTEQNRNRFVGFEIVPVRSKGVTTKINRIGLQFTEPGAYKIYLFHSSSKTPIRIIEVFKNYGNTMEWFTMPDLYLPYVSDDIDAGGSWYIGYLQSELPEGSRAIRKEKDWSKEPCHTCSRQDIIAWKAWSKYLEVHPFCVGGEEVMDEVGVHLWDIKDNVYTYDTNYGINLDVSVGCDITDFIIEQRAMFQDVIGKQLAIDMLREFVYNSNARTNRHSINASRIDILYELDGDTTSMKQSGLSYQLDVAFKALTISTQGIDHVCQTCKNNGIKYRTI